MNWLDVIIILALLYSAYSGFKQGLIGSVLPMIGIILGVIIAGRYYGSLSGLLDTWLESEAQIKIIGFIIIFVLFMIVVFLIVRWLRKLINLTFLGWVDRSAGLIFGLIMGVVTLGTLLSLITHFFDGADDTIADSALAAFLLDKLPLVSQLLPNEFDSVSDIFK